jgi:hypothetical protein
MKVRVPAFPNGASFPSTACRSSGQEKQSGALGGIVGGSGVGIIGSAGLRFGTQSMPRDFAKRISRAYSAISRAG